MGTAFGAEFARHRLLQVLARKLLRRALGVFEAVERHHHEHVGRSAGDELAFAAMTLRLQHRLAFGLIAHRAAIAAAFEFHDVLPFWLPLSRRLAPGLATSFCFGPNLEAAVTAGRGFPRFA